jgi:hypothetical protein
VPVLLGLYASGHYTYWGTASSLFYIGLAELVLLANALWALLSRTSTPHERGQGQILLIATLIAVVPALIVPQTHPWSCAR